VVVHRGYQGKPGNALTGRSGRVAAGIAAAGLALVGGPSAAAAATSTSSTTAAVKSTALAASTAKSVTLATGDRVMVADLGGQPTYAVVGTPTGNELFDSYQTASGDHFVVPVEAVPYLGRQLDSSLFDVSALLRDGLGDGARIPISLTFTAGTTPAAPPGVTLTSVGTSSATGYLTPGSGAAFAAGLRAAIGADVRAGHQPGTGALFGGVASISLSAGGVTPVVQPHYALHILQLNAVDLTGAPVDAFAILLNTDSISKQNAFVPISGGIGRVAVPAGDYSALVSFDDFDANGNLTAGRLVTLMDFAVPDSPTTTTVAIDERTATVPISVSTPRPAVQDSLDLGWWRKDATGVAGGTDFLEFGSGPPLYTNTQPAATTGAFRYRVQWGGAGPATGPRYRYDLAFASDSLPADQNYTVRRNQLATIQQSFYTDPASTFPGSFLSGPVDDFISGYSIIGGSQAPGTLTQYLNSGESAQWRQAYFSPSGVEYDADVHTFQAGRHYSAEWAHGPLAPNVGAHTGPTSLLPCLACASPSAGTLSLGFSEGGDSAPDHTALSFFGGSTHYTLYQDGVVVADQDNVLGAELTNLPSTPTTYREVYDTDFSAVAGVSQSTSTHTDITFKYRPDLDPGNTLPSADLCDFDLVATAPCQILPVLSLSYHLATDYTNTGKVGTQSLSLDVSHLTYDRLGSHARITSASVSVSFDGGKTWQSATVLGAQGHYLALWQNPRSAAGTTPELKVTATDSVGGSITQTVANAYSIAASAH
jgi:hypothetical protein